MFHVPNQYRIRKGRIASDDAFGNNGAFEIPMPSGTISRSRGKRRFFIIASDGAGWEHVSVHVYDDGHDALRTPYWDEMCYLKDVFWDPEDVVMQLHPKKSEYINNHPNTLHLWRPTNGIQIPTPPNDLVGIKP